MIAPRLPLLWKEGTMVTTRAERRQALKKVRKRQLIDRSIIFALLLAAFVYAVYPVAGTLWNNYNIAHESRNGGHQYVPPPDGKDYSDVRASAEKYNKNLPYERLVDPWTEDTPKSFEYREYLKEMSALETMGTLRAPSIGVTLSVRHGTDEQALNKGVGHIYGTSLPVGGKNTHSALSAHSGMSTVSMFDSLEDMKKDDVFFFDTYGTTLAYKVTDITVVEPDEIESLRVQSGKDLMSLVTCTPYAVNTHRLIVTGERIPWSPEQNKGDDPFFDWGIQDWMIPWLIFTSIVLLIMMIVVISWIRTDIKRKRQLRGAQ